MANRPSGEGLPGGRQVPIRPSQKFSGKGKLGVKILPPLGRYGDESTGRGAGRSAVACYHDPQARMVEVEAKAIEICLVLLR